jgi:hypothetical protein
MSTQEIDHNMRIQGLTLQGLVNLARYRLVGQIMDVAS